MKKKFKESTSRHGDNKNQTKINSFFTTKVKDENTLEINNSSSGEEFDVKDEMLEQNNEELNEIKQVVECQQQAEAIIESDCKSVIKSNESNEFQAVSSLLNRKFDDKEKKSSEIIKQEKKEEISSQSSSTSTSSTLKRKHEHENVASTSSKHRKVELSSQKSEEIDKDIAKQRSINKAKTSKLVMLYLNRKYSKNLFGGDDPKALFKCTARRITHMFYDKNPEVVAKPKEVEKYIESIFQLHKKITSEKDLDDV